MNGHIKDMFYHVCKHLYQVISSQVATREKHKTWIWGLTCHLVFKVGAQFRDYLQPNFRKFVFAFSIPTVYNFSLPFFPLFLLVIDYRINSEVHFSLQYSDIIQVSVMYFRTDFFFATCVFLLYSACEWVNREGGHCVDQG